MFRRDRNNAGRIQREFENSMEQGAETRSSTKHGSFDESNKTDCEPHEANNLLRLVLRKGPTSGKREENTEHSRNRRLDPLGLKVLHEPSVLPTADIVFVHGLGGSSQQTWSKDHDPRLFWPLEWLPYEKAIASARISSFGYNAHFLSSSSGRKTILNISDFAKDLLFQLRFATGTGESPLNFGSVPVIFVAHSMGGLIVKKALILGRNDSNYTDIVESVSAVLFLSTPHRGSDLAKTLNNLLSACILTFSSQEYIAELRANSQTLLEINDQFRNLVSNIELFSLYETRPTRIGGIDVQILEKDSSSLGYPGEVCKPLDADHHDVCKYASQQDPNYVVVSDILRYLVTKVNPQKLMKEEPDLAAEMDVLSEALNNPDIPLDDLEYFADKRLSGSCKWILDSPTFASFLDYQLSVPQILWVSGRPGSGKSVISSFLIYTLQEQEMKNAFYFFRFGNQVKNNLTSFLLSVAWQLASEIPEYRRRLVRLFDDGLNVRKIAPRLIWRKLFADTLLKTNIRHPLFIIVDGLDETESALLLLKLLGELPKARLPLRFILVSRRTQNIAVAFDKLSKGLSVQSMLVDNADDDLRMYVEDEMEAMHGDAAFKQDISERILTKADGNFLWAHLVVNEILQCHTKDDVEDAMNHVPEDLEPLYERMDEALAKSMKPSDRALSQAILRWATCSRYPLTLDELEDALRTDHPGVLNLEHTIRTVCGEFVVVDKRSHVSMIHSSARDFLMTKPDLHFHVSPPETHHALFAKCISALSAVSTRNRTDSSRLTHDFHSLDHSEFQAIGAAKVSSETRSFWLYAATSWPYHLMASDAWADQESVLLLSRFFQSRCVLQWIYLLSQASLLRVLIQASKIMMDFLKDSEKLDAARSPLTHRLKEKSILADWANDLVRIVGKFGSQLIHHPRTIFSLIPAFCPVQSIMYRQFSQRKLSKAPQIAGLTNSEWDDCLAKFTVPGTSMPLKIYTLDRYFSILTSDGIVKLYHTSTSEEARVFSHGERVLTMSFSTSGDRLATYGMLRTKVWDTRTARHLFSITNPPRAKALTIAFTQNGETILTCSDDRVVRFCDVSEWQYGWEIVQDVFGGELTEKSQYTSPQKVSFNADCTVVAIAFRGHALMAWSLDEPRPWLIGRCEGQREQLSAKHVTRSKVLGAHALCWNPMTGHVLGISNEGYIFKWHPFDQDYASSITRATNIECSADGRYFVTSSRNGVLRVWDFEHFTPIYKLSYAASIQDFAIDRNDIRIYDIRDRFCNVWEPSAIMRLLNSDDKASETTSTYESSLQTNVPSEALVDALEPVTALAMCPNNDLYAVGTDEGRISVFTSEGNHLADLSERFMTIEQICWSPDGSMVASVDLSRSVLVEQLVPQPDGFTTATLLVAAQPNIVRQVLFNAASNKLLVSTNPTHAIYQPEGGEGTTQTFSDSESRKWINHPLNNNFLLGFSCDNVKVCRWDDCEQVVLRNLATNSETEESFFELRPEMAKRRPSESYPMSPAEITKLVTKVLLSLDGRMALIEISESTTQGKRRKKHMMIDMSSVLDLETDRIATFAIPAEVQPLLEVSLGFLPVDVGQRRLSAPSHHHHRRLSDQSSLRLPTSPRSTSPSPLRRPTPLSSSHSSSTLLLGEEHILAFINRDFWVCTAAFTGNQAGRIDKHFFLPRDWVNLDWLELAALTNDGKILCPRNGEVAVISNGFEEVWRD
ncbi:uncharacterized protein A1O9_03719 [Exophiala aquamarina CBS 119918]|uniref:Uncharacterized protein n=1 Tax=Exophiala aquamarina CBS 119918 TaxID=1182545 RepID=A0A072PG98_9EURO|nr:uncharacterized protein A1O9_03719 [Exophiala aquamarina CBS 119918]KEF58876.1 hypothetical protein A1O9_03719 [Exophiala aquamarina CBS 119918]